MVAWAFSIASSAWEKARNSRHSRASSPTSTHSKPSSSGCPTTNCRVRPAEFRQRLDNGATLDDILVEAFAVTREAADRVIGQRHYDVQMMGGAALHFGWVAEMKTGEGKTLVSTLPVYLNGVGGKGVHLVTVNDYLARFATPSGWAGSTSGSASTVGLIIPGFKDAAGREAPQLRRRHHVRHQQRVRLRLPPRQHGAAPRRQGAAWPQLLHRRRGRLDPHRRGPHAADHLRPRRRRRQALLPLRIDHPIARTRRRLRGRRRQAGRRAHRGRHRARSRPRSASTTSTTTSRPTSCTSSPWRSRPRSSTSATRTTSCRAAR